MSNLPIATIPFQFDRQRLLALGEANSHSYRTAAPFPHIVFDDFLPDAVVGTVLDEFPSPSDDVDWQVFDSQDERKFALADDWRMGIQTRQLLRELNSATFLDFLEHLTGISGLVPDPHLVGGGLHQISNGGYLKVHADFNVYRRLNLCRRLNVLVYLNRDWRDEYGGHLELWDRSMSTREKAILPMAGRCVIFSTTDYSYHGHPDPLTCPPGTSRKSLALYYYTNGRPPSEASPDHTTLFRARPGERAGRRSRVRDLAKGLTPPLAVEGYRQLALRVRHSR